MDIAGKPTDKDVAAYAGAREYGNQQFKEEMMPTYEEIAGLFKGRMYLEYPSTRGYYSKLIDSIEIWRRSLAKIPPFDDVAQGIVDGEKQLQLFYEDVEKNFTRLQKKLSGCAAF